MTPAVGRLARASIHCDCRARKTNGAITLQFRSQKATILSPFTFLVPAETDVVAALLRRCRRSIAMDDCGVEEIGSMKLQHRACKHGIKTAVRLATFEMRYKCACSEFLVGRLDLFSIGSFFPLGSPGKAIAKCS